MTEPLAPGKTLGILGGGQLGRFIAEAAKGLGYRTAALDSSPSSPALQIVDIPIVGSVDDATAAMKLAMAANLLTLEWELIPAVVLERVAKARTLFPAPSVLAIIQDRLIQKNFLAKHGFPQTPYGGATTAAGWKYPVILKRRTHGYDGKGQCRLERESDAPRAAKVLQAPCVWEKKVDFKAEISVILARGRDGKTAVYPVAENAHRDGVLHATRAPAKIPRDVEAKAVELANKISEALGHVGVMAVEMFLLHDESLLVNEIAPRVHNSGHYTLGGCAVSQFEQHVRAVCGLPLGDTRLLEGHAAMVNLLGDLWEKGEPRWSLLDEIPGAKLHLYGKSDARPGRKMGHYTVVGAAAEAEFERADDRLKALRG
ncbi:MAG: 5-(carboxyamino)imidazole ribonucleotide synthase [Elusimicrobiota bacterium]